VGRALIERMGIALGVHSFGTELRCCQLDGFRISETLMPSGLRLQDHKHEPGQICFVLEGEYTERTAGIDHQFYPGALQFHSPGEWHSNIFSSDSDVLTLLISIDPERWIDIATSRPVVSAGILRYCAREIHRELRRLDEASRAAVEGWAMLSLSTLARRHGEIGKHEPAWLSEAAAIIERRSAEPISLTTIAAEVGVHRATLAAAFRRFRRSSVGETIRNQRVRQVMHALAFSKMPLCEIAIGCGFHDQAHMGREFRKAIGISPGAYRSGRRHRRSHFRN
jgi:AraC family transcriptional regulator